MDIPPLIEKVQGAHITAPQGGGQRPIVIRFNPIQQVAVFDPTADAIQIASILMLKVPSGTLRETLRILNHYISHEYSDLVDRVPISINTMSQLDLFFDR